MSVAVFFPRPVLLLGFAVSTAGATPNPRVVAARLTDVRIVGILREEVHGYGCRAIERLLADVTATVVGCRPRRRICRSSPC